MAKGYLEKRLKDLGRKDIEVSSAGIISLPGARATEETEQIIKEAGGDISNHVARKITELEVKEADLIFVMEGRHKKYILDYFPGAEKKVYFLKCFKEIGNFEIPDDCEIKDPIGKDINFYKEVFSAIKDSIERILRQV